MSDNQKHSLTLSINTVLTACTTIIVAMAGWLVTGQLKSIKDNQTIAIEKFQIQSDATYETQANHNKDVEALHQADSKQWTQLSSMETKIDNDHAESMQEFGKLDTEYQILMNAVDNNKNKYTTNYNRL